MPREPRKNAKRETKVTRCYTPETGHTALLPADDPGGDVPHGQRVEQGHYEFCADGLLLPP